jgi:ferric iron reductase protein FhuF
MRDNQDGKQRTLRHLLAVLMDHIVLDHAVSHNDWENACLFSGRYTDLFLQAKPVDREVVDMENLRVDTWRDVYRSPSCQKIAPE